MAWKVYDAMPGQDAIGRNSPAIYGPLPCKRWVSVPGEKYKMRKLSTVKGWRDWRAEDSHRAIEYALWLARRDGITISADTKAMPLWAHVESKTRKNAKGAPVIEERISAVCWHAHVSGRYVGPALARVDLPNWDWQPDAPREELVANDVLFADMLARGLAILAQAEDCPEAEEMADAA